MYNCICPHIHFCLIILLRATRGHDDKNPLGLQKVIKKNSLVSMTGQSLTIWCHDTAVLTCFFSSNIYNRGYIIEPLQINDLKNKGANELYKQ